MRGVLRASKPGACGARWGTGGVQRVGYRCGGTRHAKVDTGRNVKVAAGQETAEKLSASYTGEMQKKMGSRILTYRHEDGMNYARILDDVIVGSCLQAPQDVDKLKAEGVTTILCLQQDRDLQYFGLNIDSIQNRCKELGIRHIRCPVRDFDPVDLRKRLPKIVALLEQEHDPKEGVAYVHCTAGMGRAPAVALAYMVWCREYSLQGANYRLQAVRPCGPKLHAIREATCDILLGTFASDITITVAQDPTSTVEISGLNIGWDTRVPMEFDKKLQRFVLHRSMLPGRYSFKLLVDGSWTCSSDYPIAADGAYENNYVDIPPVSQDPYVDSALSRIQSEFGPINLDERWKLLAAIRRLQPCSEECLFE